MVLAGCEGKDVCGGLEVSHKKHVGKVRYFRRRFERRATVKYRRFHRRPLYRILVNYSYSFGPSFEVPVVLYLQQKAGGNCCIAHNTLPATRIGASAVVRCFKRIRFGAVITLLNTCSESTDQCVRSSQ